MRKGNSMDRATTRSADFSDQQQRNLPSSPRRDVTGGVRPRRTDNNNPPSSGGGRGQQMQHQQQHLGGARPNEIFGYIVSLRETFGFIQPYLSEDQVFFAFRDAYREVAIGDEIGFVSRMTPKGWQAEGLRKVSPEKKASTAGVRGIVTREPDTVRGTPGIIKVEIPSSSTAVVGGDRDRILPTGPKESFIVPYLAEDSGSSASSRLPRSNDARDRTAARPSILKGDEVEFSLVKIEGTAYVRAQLLRLTRTKRDRLLAEQVQSMLAAGAVREQGVIDTIRGGEYGFIKPADRPDQLYFKVDDVLDQEQRVSEGLEVEFFVIVENSKGKLSDRAVHIQVLPKGTVIFETTVAEGVLATVIAETKAHPREEPGLLRLHTPVPRGGGTPDLQTIELWQRCLSDGLICKVGDTLRIDVQNYRPEKLFFARSVRVAKFRSIGREIGTVCVVRDHFGFIKSGVRDVDIYFRLADIVGDDGNMIKEADVALDMTVSFDVTIEEAGRGSNAMRLRAVRVRKMNDHSSSSTGGGPSAAAATAVSPSNNSSSSPSADAVALGAGVANLAITNNSNSSVSSCTVNLLLSGVKGTVLRDAKRDAPGIVRVPISATHDPSSGGGSGSTNSDSYEEVIRNYPEILEAVEEFKNLPELKEVVLDSVTSSLRKIYHMILNEKFTGIAHESIQVNSTTGNKDPGKGRPLRLWKLAEAEYETWLTESKAGLAAKAAHEAQAQGDGKNRSNNKTSSKAQAADFEEVLFHRADTSDEYGPVAKDLDVLFDLCFDKKTNKKVAKNLRLTDEPVPGFEAAQEGILDVVFSRNGRFGFVRCVPSDEKLFWHSSGAAAGSKEADLSEGKEVSFTLRKRGGLRCAVNISVLPPFSLSKEIILEETCTAIVVEPTQVVLLDVSHNLQMVRKYWDITKIPDILHAEKKMKNNNSRDNSKEKKCEKATWEREPQTTDGESAAAAAAAGAEDVVAEEASPLVTTTEEESSSSPQDGGIKYFPPLVRAPIPIGRRNADGSSASILNPGDVSGKSDSGVEGVKVGQLVTCKVVVNWGLQRHPVMVCDVTPTSTATLSTTTTAAAAAVVSTSVPPIAKMRGTIQRVKTRIKGGGSDGTGYELTEISLTSLVNSVGEEVGLVLPPQTQPVLFFCDNREVKPLEEVTSRESMQVGDEVEFLGITAINVAVGAVVLPKKIVESGIVFKRNPVNAQLKDSTSKVKVGLRSIIMAEGPPDEGKSVGFAQGWRDAPQVDGLPWSHLLPHMIGPSSPVVNLSVAAPAFVPSDAFLANTVR